MNPHTQNEHGGFSVESVEGRLRALAAVEPPESLRDRLAADIADSAVVEPQDRYLGLWSRQARWATAAAAVILVASMIGWLGFPLSRQVRPAPDSTSGPGYAQAVDHNSLMASDTNSYDTNSLR